MTFDITNTWKSTRFAVW